MPHNGAQFFREIPVAPVRRWRASFRSRQLAHIRRALALRTPRAFLVVSGGVFLAITAVCGIQFLRLSNALRFSHPAPQATGALHDLAAAFGTAVLFSACAGFLILKQFARQSRERAQAEAARQIAQQQKQESRRELLNAEEKFRVLFDHSSEAYLLVDETTILDCNQSAVRMLRAPGKQQIVGRSPHDFAPEVQSGSRSSLDPLQSCRQLPGEGGFGRFDCVYSRLDGSDLHVEVSLTAIPLHGKALTLVAWHDLTERREAEEALLRSATRLRVAQRIVHLGHWEYEPRADRLLWSEEALRIFGFTSESETRTLQSCFRRIHPEDRAAAREALDTAIGPGMPVEVYFRLLLPDGSIRHVDCRSRSDLNATGTVVRVSGTILRYHRTETGGSPTSSRPGRKRTTRQRGAPSRQE